MLAQRMPMAETLEFARQRMSKLFELRLGLRRHPMHGMEVGQRSIAFVTVSCTWATEHWPQPAVTAANASI